MKSGASIWNGSVRWHLFLAWILALSTLSTSTGTAGEARERRELLDLRSIEIAAPTSTSAPLLPQAPATARTWANGGADFNAGTSWVGGIAPGLGDVAVFTGDRSVSPVLTASKSIAGLFFSGTPSAGYDLTNSGGAILTLTGTSTTGSSGTSDSTAAAIRSEDTGIGAFSTNAVDAPITLAPSTGTTSTFFQAVLGKLRIGGSISGTGITLNLNGAGQIEFDVANTYTGGTTVSGAGLNVLVGNNNALGTGTLTMSATATLTGSSGLGITIPNAVVLGGNTTVGGSETFSFGGAVTSSGSASRSLTLNNSALTSMSSLNLAESETARGLTINGAGSLTISGVISNNSVGNTVASPLTYSGAGTLTLNGANNYSGQTTLSSGSVVAGNKSAFGTGALAITAPSISANTDLSGANAIANTTSIGGNPTFTGTNNLQFSGTVSDTGTRTITNNMSGGAVLTFSGGVNLSSSASNFTMNITGTGNTTISGAIANGGTSTADNLTKAGNGTLTLTNASNTYTGATTVNAGTLIVGVGGVGSVTSAISVTAGTLGGSGSTTGAVTIGNGTGTGDSFISPGNSVGTFTTTNTLSIANDGVYTFELNSNTATADKIVANGVTLAAQCSIALTDLGNTVLAPGTVFRIIDNTAATAIAGTFSNLSEGQLLNIGPNTYQASYLGGTGNDLILTLVPEPSTWTMVALGGGLLVAVQRLRRKTR